MSNVITLATPPQELENIEAITSQCSLALSNASGNFQRALTMAAGIRMLRNAITPKMMVGIMELQGTKLGFRTDKDSGQGYPENIVKECVIEHVLRGGMLVGNEMNIIAGNVYQTKEFFTRMLAEHPGLTDLKLFPGVPVSANSGALVPYSATWKLHGKADRIDRGVTRLDDGSQLDERIPVKVNNGMGSDAILGKAERKIRAAIYARITGTVITDGDIGDSEPPRRQVQNLSDLTQRLEEKSGDSALKPGETMKPDGEITTEQTEPHAEDSSQTEPDFMSIVADMKAELSDAKDLAAVQRIEDFYLPKVPADKSIEVHGPCDEKRETIRASRGSKSNQKELAGTK